MRHAAIAARFSTLAAALLFSTTCQMSDLLKPGGLERIEMAFAGDSVLVVAAPTRATVTVKVNGAAFADARLGLASSDSGVVAVHGDTLVPKQRGTATLTVQLLGSALPREAPGLEQHLFVVADTVTVDSASVHLVSLGDTVTLAATGRDAKGGAIAGATAKWASSDTTVAAVSAAGRVTARANGTVTLRAMLDRDTALIPVTVTQQLTKWTFEPASLRVDALTATASVAATGHDARGAAITGLAPATWSVGDATVVSVSTSGDVTAVKNGTTWLFAARGAVRDSLPVTVAQRAIQVAVTPKPAPPVTSVGAQVQLTGRAFDRRTVEIQGAPLSWLTLEPSLARVGSDGLVTALAVGTAHIVATLDLGADTATVAISNDPATIAVSPDSALATSVGDTLVFRAVARNGRGDSVGAAIAWHTPDTAVANVLADGRAIGLAVGVARVIATVGAKADTGLAKVTNVPTAIAIAPVADTCRSLGDVDTLPVTITNARGAALPRGSATWTSDDPLVVRVSTSGVMTARDTGQTVVRATSGLVVDSVLVTVLNLPASIVINSPAVDTLTAAGQTLNLPVDVRNARGAPILNYPVAWRSTNRAAVDTVRPTGDAMAVGWGSTLLIAGAGGRADTVKLAVVNPTRLYVSNALFTGLRVGTTARPYARIQDAVSAADAGDTVLVLRGAGGYSESVSLVRRVTILGDSAAYVSSGRNPAFLPLLAHDTGASAIAAHTTAPVTVRYLAIRHTLDGPAFDGDGADAVLEWVYVNPAGSVTSRIGRGLSVRNSSSGTILRNVRVFSVRGYGISLVNSSAAEVSWDSIAGVDSIGVPEGGAGISLRGGTSINVYSNVIRSTRGPRILVRGATSAWIMNHWLSGRHPLIQLDSVTGGVHILADTFQIGRDYSDAADDPNCPTDTRCAGVLITDSRNGALVGGYSLWAYTSPAEISANTFYDGFVGASVGEGIGIRVRNSMAYGNGNRFRYIQAAHQMEGNSKGYFSGETADTSGVLGVLMNADSLYLGEGTTHGAAALAHFAETPAGTPYIQLMNGNYDRPSGSLVNVWDPAANADIENVTFSCAPNNQALLFYGSNLSLWGDSILGRGDSVPGYEPGGPYNGGVSILYAGLQLYHTRIAGFNNQDGLNLFGPVPDFYASQSVLTGNRIGLHVDGTVGPGLSLSGAGNNSVFDNLVAGLQDDRPSGGNLPGWWWGDGRGPRGAANPAATGDSVIAAGAPFNPLTAPAAALTGTVGAALRLVRGTAQGALAGTALPKAFTVRAIDAIGLPVAGVTVTFTVTGGGGNFGGQSTVRFATNGDGLAEATLTLGATQGANAATATATGLNTVTFTATAH